MVFHGPILERSVDMKREKLSGILEKIYVIYLIGAVFIYSLNATMVDHQWLFDYRVFTLYGLAGALFVACKTLLEIRTWNWKEILLGGFVGMSLFLYFWKVHFIDGVMNTFQLLVLFIGAHHVDFKKIIKAYIGTKIVVLVAAYVLSMLGYASYLVIDDWTTLFGRHAFGTIFPTDFSANFVYLSVMILWLRADRINYIDITANVFSAFFVYRYCKARNSAICLLLLAVIACVAWIVKMRNGKETGRISFLHRIMTFSMPIGACIMVVLTYGYQSENRIFAKLNSVLSGRLSLGKRGFLEYPISLFGQEVSMNGFGGGLKAKNYFYLDSSYIYVLLLGGVLVFVSCILIHTVLATRACNEKKYLFIYLLLVISLHCAVEQHIMDVAYNPFMLSLLASFPFGTIDKTEENAGQEYGIIN